jgi:hypothetical protein
MPAIVFGGWVEPSLRLAEGVDSIVQFPIELMMKK